jgi:hypothetical protein
MQGDLGLNICEAHAFNTSDRFSLDIFVVDGWAADSSKESLEIALSNRFAQVAPSAQGAPEMVDEAARAERRLSNLVRTLYCQVCFWSTDMIFFNGL